MFHDVHDVFPSPYFCSVTRAVTEAGAARAESDPGHCLEQNRKSKLVHAASSGQWAVTEIAPDNKRDNIWGLLNLVKTQVNFLLLRQSIKRVM